MIFIREWEFFPYRSQVPTKLKQIMYVSLKFICRIDTPKSSLIPFDFQEILQRHCHARIMVSTYIATVQKTPDVYLVVLYLPSIIKLDSS